MYDVTIRQLPQRAVFELQGQQDRLREWCTDLSLTWPDAPCAFTTTADTHLLWIGPTRWLLLAPLPEEVNLSRALRFDHVPDDISIVTLSDTLTFFDLSGPDVMDVFAVASPLDLMAPETPKPLATWTEAFGQKALVRRTQDGVELGVDRSFGPMVQDYWDRILSN